ncbi:NAD(P)/FAD-dependent oxidoreductase [Trinickia fusca]|uniref:FAD-binding oxidoreductase n=1 Tax=Trinickia fusca TaxID=2419777 RepID=A0A494X3I2_9BURK|nr:FAD-dependent oxidoreductase [Trinickia fusca]RKP45258.1 FAD-binding oxidoreductase [Trinickia fusca]
MHETTDAIVVGGGSTGCSIAYHLLGRGLKVLVLERAALGSGTTAYSPAIIRQNYADIRVSKLAHESIRVFEHWHEEVGGNCGFVQCGFLTAFAEEDRALQQGRAEDMKRHGIAVDVLDPDDIVALQPDFNREGIAGGVFETRGGYCDTAATIESLSRGIRRRGGTIHEHCDVMALRVAGDQVVGVQTRQGAIDAPIVINAAGAWAGQLAKTADIDLPITVSRHCIALFTQPVVSALPRLFAYQERRVDRLYMRSMIGGLSMVGSFDAADSFAAQADHHSTVADEEKVAQYQVRAARRFGRFATARALGGWASVFDDTADGNPLIGADPDVRGLYVAAGMNGHCFKLAPVIGQGLAEIVTDGATSIDLGVFAPGRFR